MDKPKEKISRMKFYEMVDEQAKKYLERIKKEVFGDKELFPSGIPITTSEMNNIEIIIREVKEEQLRANYIIEDED